jgi:hypothetical protein
LSLITRDSLLDEQLTTYNEQQATRNLHAGYSVMAEIKSTLDIIMEKAKKFSVTEEERQGFKRQELEGKIKGLVQKTLDGILDFERFQVELAALQAKERDLVDQILKDEVVTRIEVEVNSEELLKMLEYVAGSASSGVRKVLADFEKKGEKQKEIQRKTLLESFKKKGISGSAVLPNLDADAEWARVRSELRRDMQEKIREQLKSLPTSL